MAFIRTIPPAEAEGPVREMYEQAQSRSGYVPNWAQAFSLRPGVRTGWVALLSSIQSNLPVRSYELATLAAARALRSSYCALAHGSILADKVFDTAAVAGIATDAAESPLEPRERALMTFVEKVVRSADQVTPADVEGLRTHGYRDEEIFDALGVQPDSSFNDLDPTLRQALTVGRPVSDSPMVRVPSQS